MVSRPRLRRGWASTAAAAAAAVTAASAPPGKGKRTVNASDRTVTRGPAGHTGLPAVIHVSSVVQSHQGRPAQNDHVRLAVQWMLGNSSPVPATNTHHMPGNNTSGQHAAVVGSCFTAVLPVADAALGQEGWRRCISVRRFRRRAAGAEGTTHTTHPCNDGDRRCHPMASVASERVYARRICTPLSTEQCRADRVFAFMRCRRASYCRRATQRYASSPIMRRGDEGRGHKRHSWLSVGGGAAALPLTLCLVAGGHDRFWRQPA